MEWVKTHKWWLIGGVAVIAVVYFASGSGSSSSGSSDYSTEVQAATALQSAQLQANAQAQQYAAGVQANQDTINGQIALAQIQQQMNQNNNDAATQVSLAQISAAQQVDSLLGTLQAQTQQNAQNQVTAQTAITVNGTTQQETVFANALTSIAQQQANVAISAQQTAAQVATSCHGLSCLF